MELELLARKYSGALSCSGGPRLVVKEVAWVEESGAL
jgi:hypothetical protein